MTAVGGSHVDAVYSGQMSSASSPVPFDDSAPKLQSSKIDREDTIELLGLVAHIESNSFLQVSLAAAAAPAPEQRLRLSRVAGRALERQELMLNRMVELGLSPEAAAECMFGFDGTFDDYNARTEPSTLWESLLKEYVGHGVADDFCRIIARNLDARTREVVTTVLDGGVTSDTAVDTLAQAAQEDEVLASRLALWGRRLVGEALSVVQALIAERAALGHLIEAAIADSFAGDREKAPADSNAWLFAQLTAEHTRRMSRLGLAA